MSGNEEWDSEEWEKGESFVNPLENGTRVLSHCLKFKSVGDFYRTNNKL